MVFKLGRSVEDNVQEVRSTELCPCAAFTRIFAHGGATLQLGDHSVYHGHFILAERVLPLRQVLRTGGIKARTLAMVALGCLQGWCRASQAGIRVRDVGEKHWGLKENSSSVVISRFDDEFLQSRLASGAISVVILDGNCCMVQGGPTQVLGPTPAALSQDDLETAAKRRVPETIKEAADRLRKFLALLRLVLQNLLRLLVVLSDEKGGKSSKGKSKGKDKGADFTECFSQEKVLYRHSNGRESMLTVIAIRVDGIVAYNAATAAWVTRETPAHSTSEDKMRKNRARQTMDEEDKAGKKRVRQTTDEEDHWGKPDPGSESSECATQPDGVHYSLSLGEFPNSELFVIGEPTCLNDKSHAKHDPLADNCIFFGVTGDITPAVARRVLLEREIAWAKASVERQQRAVAKEDATSGDLPADYIDDYDDITGNLLADPLQELFGISGHDKNLNAGSPVQRRTTPDLKHDDLEPLREDVMRGKTPAQPRNEKDESCHIDDPATTETIGAASEVPNNPREPPAPEPEPDSRDLLQPLPPGWQRDDTFAQGLHPTTDVFDDLQNENYNAVDQDGGKPCDKGVSSSPLPSDVDFDPDVPSSPVPAGDGPDDDQQGSAPRAWDKGETQGVLEPEGTPPPLTAQQRARLHAILQARDPDGRVPYGLDKYKGDAAKWAAYRFAEDVARGEIPQKDGSMAKFDRGDPRPRALRHQRRGNKLLNETLNNKHIPNLNLDWMHRLACAEGRSDTDQLAKRRPTKPYTDAPQDQ
ncbi:hypothetical protein AK812_SmicGene28073 [Symbiodinium microadriaticum]|uniref:Uncharacterized protein n=1 Tax=Symbiodinium microadriaticum TaxID=2951 RepID=A0A1Q9D573_SYMMI|nr:hypothetical protein AK812_SmicGene28073 [Symbiodinium microadriaticum]